MNVTGPLKQSVAREYVDLNILTYFIVKVTRVCIQQNAATLKSISSLAYQNI